MITRAFLEAFLATAGAVGASRLGAQDRAHNGPTTERLGVVRFITSCTAAAQPQFLHGVALLHSFEFSRAIDAFNATLNADPSCAMAEWGIALSRWTNPTAVTLRSPDVIRGGRQAVERGTALGAKTERERAYIDAVAWLYADAESTPQGVRVAAYRDAMADVVAKFPEDTEAAIFYALALTAAASPSDKSYADQLKAGAILEKLFAQQPTHPGLAHYIIHAYDVPPLAGRALDAAGRYSRIAPSAPHALHMPSHTYTRVGDWQKSIAANIASAASARANGVTAEELHANDYLMYAYLQTGRDAASRRILESLPAIASRFDPDAIGGAAPGSAGVFALAAMPARFTLERGDWAGAARLPLQESKFPHTEAMTHFARAIGASHLGDTAVARASVEALRRISSQLVRTGEGYWGEQVRIQQLGASAWLALAEGRAIEALDLMRAAADAEDRTEKNAVTPGPLAPARELLGEMFMQANDPARALLEFEATLVKEPDRFRALFGAARAAEAAGNSAKARQYFGRIVKVCERGDRPGRAELAQARRSRRG